MKREARQHGIVRTYRWSPIPKTRHVRRIDPVTVSGSFSSVISKAGSHSEFTGKCGKSQWVQCHSNPVGKSKDKTKGAQKFRTTNIAGFKFSGFSATGVLEYLDRFNEENEIDDHDVNDHDYVNENGGAHVLVDEDDDDFMAKFWSLHDKQNDTDDDSDEDEDDYGIFCDVGFRLDIEEDEGW
ncbi:hypothetical protein F3Y22_tig00110621pilonHSYRG00283 [Hibiscus syriacus]|uniref:Uncharacterized protein n=1 Tax=Hibiscus syriacus TaxID=106335 RepID=A0A6A3A0U4_HIBSY|nr:uncharacterized protein LOC120135892 [Hibiscus syriacus]KAE8697446.1 hypothetical protein F3Y22_tig00110621pilonHSYRG00283 [Hibiscus syriacus]